MAHRRETTNAFRIREQPQDVNANLKANEKGLVTARDGKNRVVRAFNVPRSVELPILLGVNGLSKQEIRKDLRDIERTIPTECSESDCSVISDEVMPGSYPVKPRSNSKWTLNGAAENTAELTSLSPNSHLVEEEGDDYDDVHFQETIEFLKTVEKSRDGLFRAERQREQLELLYLSLRDTYVFKAKEKAYRGRGQENLLRALQGLCVRNIRLVSLLHRRNAVMCDVIKALRWKSRACSMLKQEHRPRHTAEDSASILKVQVLSPGSPTRTLTLYLGLALGTPYGEAIVEDIRPNSQIVGVRLEWGASMHCPLARLVCWGPFDLASDRHMCTKWDSLGKRVRIHHSYAPKIAAIISSRVGGAKFSNDDYDDEYQLQEQTNGDSDVAMEHAYPEDASYKPSPSKGPESVPEPVATECANEILRGCHWSLPLPAQGIPFLLAPVRALPVMLDELKNKPGIEVQAFRQALDVSFSPFVQSLEAARMQLELNSLQEAIKALEKTHTSTLAQVQANRKQTDALTQMNAAIRAQMLTRKQRQRSLLQAHGVCESSIAAATTSATTSVVSAPVSFRPSDMLPASATAMDMLAAVLANESMKSLEETGSVRCTLNSVHMEQEVPLGSGIGLRSGLQPPASFMHDYICDEGVDDVRAPTQGNEDLKVILRTQRKSKQPRTESNIDGRVDSDADGVVAHSNPNRTPSSVSKANGSNKRNKRRKISV